MTVVCSDFFSNIFIGVAGVGIGSYLTYYFSTRLFARQRLCEASSKFRETFIDEIVLCEKEVLDGQARIIDLTGRKLIEAEKAFIRYRAFIEKPSISGFHQAWNDYSDYLKRLNIMFKPVSGIGSHDSYTSTNEEERRKMVLHKINNLLKYAPTQ
ncbi:MAG: hypothetical protein KAT62_03725 [Desulfuromonadales bacterium]|nr:hypothetical protein [Desulfuromonadales bacterium]